MDWKEIVSLVFWVIVIPFISGLIGGMLYAKHKGDKTFDVYPSPLACHIDNSCTLKDLQ